MIGGWSSDHYVSPDGNDRAVGSARSPWQSITTALERSEPGDTVHLLPGTYYEKVIITVSGEEGAPITLAGQEGAIIDGSQEAPEKGVGYWGGLVELKGVEHVVVKGLTVKNAKGSALFARSNDAGEPCGNLEFSSNTADTSNGSGIGVWECKGLVVTGNKVSNGPLAGSGAGIQLVDVVDFQVSENSVTSYGSDEVSEDGISVARDSSKGTVTANAISDVFGRGIVIESWEAGTIGEVRIDGNTITDADTAVEIGVAAGGSVEAIDISANTITTAGRGLVASLADTASGTAVLFVNNVVTDLSEVGLEAAAPESATEATLAVGFINNTVYGTAGTTEQVTGGAVSGSLSDTSEVTLQNNILAALTRATVIIDDKVPAGVVAIDTNLFTESGFGRSGETQGDNAIVTSDPVFTDAAGSDFTLASNSPAIDVGKSEGAPATDCVGVTRPQGVGHDVGAYERAP